MTNSRSIPKDWNPAVHILDDLSEGAHSLTEMLYGADDCGLHSYSDAMLFLMSRELVQFTRPPLNLRALAYEDAAEVFREAMSVPQEQRGSFSNIQVDLTKTGEQVLTLLGLGHP